MKREGCSYRRTPTKKKKNLSSKVSISAITEFFSTTRVFQNQFPDISQKLVFNRDQVPIALAPSYSTRRIMMSSGTLLTAETKRFCTLNLIIPMTVRADLGNLIRPHLVFKATRFVRGED